MSHRSLRKTNEESPHLFSGLGLPGAQGIRVGLGLYSFSFCLLSYASRAQFLQANVLYVSHIESPHVQTVGK